MKVQALNFHKAGLMRKEWWVLKRLSSPKKIQDFLNSIPFNFEKNGETHSSVRYSLKRGRVHCFEGALIAAAALWINGEKPLILDLKTVRPDFDHVVTLFKRNGCWGAISKTNHAVLRYRDPIYKSARELVTSYFHEYFLESGKKTLRSYSKPLNLSRLGTGWLTTDENLAWLAHMLDKSPHSKVLSSKQARNLRKADRVERKVADITEYKR